MFILTGAVDSANKSGRPCATRLSLPPANCYEPAPQSTASLATRAYLAGTDAIDGLQGFAATQKNTASFRTFDRNSLGLLDVLDIDQVWPYAGVH